MATVRSEAERTRASASGSPPRALLHDVGDVGDGDSEGEGDADEARPRGFPEPLLLGTAPRARHERQPREIRR